MCCVVLYVCVVGVFRVWVSKHTSSLSFMLEILASGRVAANAPEPSVLSGTTAEAYIYIHTFVSVVFTCVEFWRSPDDGFT